MTTVAIPWTIVGRLARVPWIRAADTVMAKQARDTGLAAVQVVAMACLAILRVGIEIGPVLRIVDPAYRVVVALYPPRHCIPKTTNQRLKRREVP